MVVNPDDLLIFRARKEAAEKKGATKEQPEVKKAEAKPKPEPEKPVKIELPGLEYQKMEKPREQPAPKPVPERIVVIERPKEIPKPAPQPKPQPVVVERPKEIPRPAPQPRPQPVVERPVIQQAPPRRPEPKAVEKPKEVEQPKPKVEVYRPKPTIELEVPRPATVYRPTPTQVERGKVVPPTGTMEQVKEAEAFFSPIVGEDKRRTKGEQMDAAKGMRCVWHQWRDAYAICDLCGRPFCYEDSMEYHGKYYCLEDIDKVNETPTATAEVFAYSKLGIASAGLMLLSFVVFLSFALPEVVYVVGYANSVGFFDFVKVVNFDYMAAILGIIITSLGVIGALLIFIQSKGGFLFGLFVGFVGVVLFSYQFLNSSTIYAGIISVIDFASMVILIYSRSAGYGTSELIASQQEQLQLDWPNAGNF